MRRPNGKRLQEDRHHRDHDDADDDEHRHTEDALVDRRQHPARQLVGGDLLTAGIEVGRAAIERHRAERRDQRRDLAIGDDQAVDRAEHEAERHRDEDHLDPGARVMRRVVGGEIGAEPHDRADRDVEVARQEHDGLGRRDDGEDRGVRGDDGEVLHRQELRRQRREDRAEQDQEGDDPGDAQAQRDLAHAAAWRTSGRGLDFSGHAASPPRPSPPP